MSLTPFSKDNKFIRLAKQLKQKKYRDIHKLFVVEGYKNCVEVIKQNAKILCVFITTDFSKKSETGFLKDIEKVFTITDKLLQVEISDEETPQGILLIAEKQVYSLKDCINEKSKFVLILDKLRDPGNVGTILRTAVAFNLSAVLLTEGTVDLYNPKVVRASAGFLFNMPVLENITIKEIIPVLNKLDFSVIAADSKKGKNVSESELKFPLALIVGNEGQGLDKTILAFTKNYVRIPMSEKVDSLNVSVATGILIYEINAKLKT